VEKEIDKLISEINGIGKKVGSEVHVTFGDLFHRYQDVSDTLVGILQRAKKRGLVKYEGEGGDLLLQGRHNHVMIILDHSKAAAWQKEYKATGGKSPTVSSPPQRPPAAVEKKPAIPALRPVAAVTTSSSAASKFGKPATAGPMATTKPASSKSAQVQPKSAAAKKVEVSPKLLIGIGLGMFVVFLIALFLISRLFFR